MQRCNQSRFPLPVPSAPELRATAVKRPERSVCFHFKPDFLLPSFAELTTGEEPQPTALKKTRWTSFDNYVVVLLFSSRLRADVMCPSRISAVPSQLLPARFVEMS